MGERTADRRPAANSVRPFSRCRSYSGIYAGMLTADIVIMRSNASPMRSTNPEPAEGQRDCVKAFNLTDARPEAASGADNCRLGCDVVDKIRIFSLHQEYLEQSEHLVYTQA